MPMQPTRESFVRLAPCPDERWHCAISDPIRRPVLGGGIRPGSALLRRAHQRPDLDAFPGRRINGGRILERSMERQPGAAVVGAVVHPDQYYLVGLLLRKVE